MLCAKYDYKMDIAVKQEEARAEGKEEKAIENALVLINDFKVTPELAAQKMGAPLDQLLAALNAQSTKD